MKAMTYTPEPNGVSDEDIQDILAIEGLQQMGQPEQQVQPMMAQQAQSAKPTNSTIDQFRQAVLQQRIKGGRR